MRSIRRILSFLLACLTVLSLAAPCGAVVIAVVKTEEKKDVVLTDGDGTYTITVECPAEAGVPEDAVLVTDALPSLESAAEKTLGDEQELSFARFFEVAIVDADGETVTPAAPVTVTISCGELAAVSPLTEELSVVEVADAPPSRKSIAVSGTGKKGAPPEKEAGEDGGIFTSIEKFETEAESVRFETEELTTVGVVCARNITVYVMAASGETYEITVTCDDGAGIPDGAELIAEDITDVTDEFGVYAAEAENMLGTEGTSIRLFDLSIVSGGEPVEPASPVTVSIRLVDGVSEEAQVVHFGEETEVLEAESDGETVSFETDGFSVYAIVDAPEPYTPDPTAVTTAQDLTELPGDGFFLSIDKGSRYYFKNTLKSGKKCVDRTGDITSAALWYFEPREGDDRYALYTYSPENNKVYLKVLEAPNLSYVDLIQEEEEATVFAASLYGGAEGAFFIATEIAGKLYALNYSNSNSAFKTYEATNGGNLDCKVVLTYEYRIDDPYMLDGKAFGIAYYDGKTTAAALTAEVSENDGTRLAADDMLIRPDVLDNEGYLLVSEGSDITEWTFRKVEDDRYYLTAPVGGTTQYLAVSGRSLSVVPDQAEASVFTAVPGTGANAGKWHFTVSGYSLSLPGGSAGGFAAAPGNAAATWMNLVKKSNLQEEDFHLYTAHKVSVSDGDQVYDRIADGGREQSEIIIYTRIWDPAKERYVFYVVDHDGSLVPANDIGDAIEWVGSAVNTALWRFTEYHNADGTPNYYYELQNVQYGHYIAPQLGQVVSGGTLGVNLDGRRYGYDYTTIVAWDGANYKYVGLKAEGKRVAACPLSEAEDFYFAVVKPLEHEDDLSTVKTVDNAEYGITMRMIDFNNFDGKDRDRDQKAYFSGDNNHAGLLSVNLMPDGYPVSTAVAGASEGTSLSHLFRNAGGDGLFETMTDVNHLFITSTHDESGYFEYDSTQNFATLYRETEDGAYELGTDFTVYDQIGAITGSDEHKNTREHGQFMPFDTIADGDFAIDASGQIITNRTSVTGRELDDIDPRKGEKLYNIGSSAEVDYFFGMEMEASFTQTPSGVDAWGHDIVFEFSGDDDFWLYVDGELVLDLGGVHSAMEGSINFRTGAVTSSREIDFPNADGTVTRKKTYTLREIFARNYRMQNPEASDAETEAYLGQYFENGGTVFTAYTNHTMKMFYMERGAGASNLHMRFNLAAAKPGTFLLSKKLSGATEADSSLVEFAYQIYYRTTAGSGGEGDNPAGDGSVPPPPELWTLLSEKNGEEYAVLYADSTRHVKYADSFTPAGGTQAYENVFFLRPGESAVVTLPDRTVEYRVVECGVNPDVYDRVSANGRQLDGTDTGNTVNGTARRDYAAADCFLSGDNAVQRVEYDNHVSQVQTLSLRKRLYAPDGERELHYAENPGADPDRYDNTPFTFRLYLGDENAAAPSPVYRYPYYVKDADGRYCRWDAAAQAFRAVTDGSGRTITDFDALSAYLETLTGGERDDIVFRTGNGTISGIPVDHTVEVRNLIAGTAFLVEERNGELPRGYTRRVDDGYARLDEGREAEQAEPVQGSIEKDRDPLLEVRNQRGWGLTVEKVWTDRDFMAEHDDVYFAAYLNGELLEGSVRRLTSDESGVYFHFEDLYDEQGAPHEFSEYRIYEVTLEGEDLTVDEETGIVSGYTSAVPVGEGEAVVVGGTPAGGVHHTQENGYRYTVHYELGTPTGINRNVRTDTVTNSRPGIALYKTDWNWDELAGAVFTLTDADGVSVSEDRYVSDENGLITIAYLSDGTYFLTETEAPHGFAAPEHPIAITVSESGISVSGEDETAYRIGEDETGGMTMILTVRNRPVRFTVRKTDADVGEDGTHPALPGVHFALYRQVTDIAGNPVKDYSPMDGYSDLVTDENGVLPGIGMDLPAGTYYLTETQTADEYVLPDEDLCFTVGSGGTVSICDERFADRLSVTTEDDGTVAYVLTVPNEKIEVGLKKVDENGDLLTGSVFRLRKKNTEKNTWDPVAAVDLTETAEITLLHLTSGLYRLTEEEAPDGYVILTKSICFRIGRNGSVQLTDEEGAAAPEGGPASLGPDGKTIVVTNYPGAELPQTGSSRTLVLSAAGVCALCAAGVLLRVRKREDA